MTLKDIVAAKQAERAKRAPSAKAEAAAASAKGIRAGLKGLYGYERRVSGTPVKRSAYTAHRGTGRTPKAWQT